MKDEITLNDVLTLQERVEYDNLHPSERTFADSIWRILVAQYGHEVVIQKVRHQMVAESARKFEHGNNIINDLGQVTFQIPTTDYVRHQQQDPGFWNNKSSLKWYRRKKPEFFVRQKDCSLPPVM